MARNPAPLALTLTGPQDPAPDSPSMSLSLTNPEFVAGPLLRGSVGRVLPTRSEEPPGRWVGRSVGSFRPGRKSPWPLGGSVGRVVPTQNFAAALRAAGRSVGSTRVENTENPKTDTVGRRRRVHFQLRTALGGSRSMYPPPSCTPLAGACLCTLCTPLPTFYPLPGSRSVTLYI